MEKVICTHCNYVGKPRKKKRGSTQLDVFGWLVFPLGIPYTVWRMFGKISICPHCEKETINAEGTVGQRLIQKMEDELLASIAAGGGAAQPTPLTPITHPAPPPVAAQLSEHPPRAPRPPNTDPHW